jgi:hypothetical protein
MVHDEIGEFFMAVAQIGRIVCESRECDRLESFLSLL